MLNKNNNPATKKPYKRKLFVLLSMLILSLILLMPTTATTASAAINSYDTYTEGKWGFPSKTQPAYNASKMIAPKLISGESSTLEDMCIYNDMIFLADSAGKTVRVLDLDGETLRDFGLVDAQDNNGNPIRQSDGTFNAPSGVYVYNDIIYVADKGHKSVIKVNMQGKNIADPASVPEQSDIDRFGSPTSPLFGTASAFSPTKIAVDAAENIYVTSEGNVNGVIQLNKRGEFEGYLGANVTNVSLGTLIQSLLYSKEQKETLLKKTPPSPQNIAIDSNNLIYTVTPGLENGPVRKLNTSGKPILDFLPRHYPQTIAACIADNGLLYSVAANGYITICATDTNMLFTFAGNDKLERFGALKNPIAISIVNEETKEIAVLDKGSGAIVCYTPTDFFMLMQKAVVMYQDGKYIEAEEMWHDVLRLSTNSILVYRALGHADMKKGDYNSALKNFELGEDKGAYSEAFWYVRNEWMQKNTLAVILTILLLVAIVVTIKQLKKRTTLLLPVYNFLGKVKNTKVVNQLLFSFYYMRHPVLAIEQMRYKQKLTVGPAIILYILYVIVSMLQYFVGSFTFFWNYNVDIGRMVLITLLPLVLGFVCNYFVAAVTEGEGKLKHVFIATIYSLTPFIIGMPTIIIGSYLLTLNEVVILDFIWYFMWGYSGLLLLISISKVHFYKFGGTIKNVFLTVFAALLVVLFAIIIWLLFMQVVNFTIAIFQEMML